MLRRRDRIVRELDHSSCTAIPEALRKAAAGVQGKGARDSAALADAARDALGPACQTAKEATTAWDVVGTCPLSKPDFKLADAALKDMSITDYLVLNAIQRSLVMAGEYDQTAELVLRNFSLSAALLGEQAKERNRKGRVF